jgi:gluconokinase
MHAGISVYWTRNGSFYPSLFSYRITVRFHQLHTLFLGRNVVHLIICVFRLRDFSHFDNPGPRLPGFFMTKVETGVADCVGVWIENARRRRWVVMGVSGCGKSEIGRRLATALGIAYAEGDDDHPPANVAKMASGTALTDVDRRDWLLLLQTRIAQAAAHDSGLVLSCSSLKRRYRDLLRAGDPALMFVHLHGERALIARRMRERPGHFMPPALLESQLRDLEPLQEDEAGIVLDIANSPERLIEEIMRRCR